MDSVLAAQLEAIAHGLEQITDLRDEIDEMRAIIEELSQNVAAALAINLKLVQPTGTSSNPDDAP